MFFDAWMKNQTPLELAYSLGSDARYFRGSINGFDTELQIISFVDSTQGVHYIPLSKVVWIREKREAEPKIRTL